MKRLRAHRTRRASSSHPGFNHHVHSHHRQGDGDSRHGTKLDRVQRSCNNGHHGPQAADAASGLKQLRGVLNLAPQEDPCCAAAREGATLVAVTDRSTAGAGAITIVRISQFSNLHVVGVRACKPCMVLSQWLLCARRFYTVIRSYTNSCHTCVHLYHLTGHEGCAPALPRRQSASEQRPGCLRAPPPQCAALSSAAKTVMRKQSFAEGRACEGQWQGIRGPPCA